MNRNSRILIALTSDDHQVQHGKKHLMHKHVESYQDHEHVIYDRKDRINEVLQNMPVTWHEKQSARGGLFDIINIEVNELAKARSKGTHDEIVEALAKVGAAATLALEKMTCD